MAMSAMAASREKMSLFIYISSSYSSYSVKGEEINNNEYG